MKCKQPQMSDYSKLIEIAGNSRTCTVNILIWFLQYWDWQ